MKKRILSILLLCCMVLTMLPTTASAAETGAMDNIPAKFDVEIDLCNRTSDINIKDSKTYYIYSSSSDPDFVWTKKIQINGKKAAPHIFLDNVNIQVKKDAKTPAIELHGKASAYLYFINRDSKLTGATGRAAIQKNRSEGQLCVQVMKGTTVTCQGGYKAAGIGGSWATRNIAESLFNLDMYGHGANMHFGSQTNPSLWSGTIIAKGGDGGAGIGGGRNGSGEKLYFYSGKIEAKGGETGSGIGGSFKGRGRDIYIYGGDISATGGTAGAGIGGGCWTSEQDMDGDTAAYNINIYGGKIYACGGYNGAGIGGGQYVPARDITITGGEVNAHGAYGAAIGGGRWCHGQNITVTDAKLTLTTGYNQYASNAAVMGYGDLVYSGKVYSTVLRYIGDFVRNPLPEDYKSIKIGSYHGKLIKLKVEAQAINRNDEFTFFWNLYDILIPNENGRIDVQLLTLPYVKNYGWAINAMELELIDDPCDGKHDFGWVDRQSCHVWACRNMKCQARDPVAPESARNGKHASSGWNTETHQLVCDVCGHIMETDTKAPVLEVLKDGESYTVEDNINGNPGAYTFTVSDPALNGEASSGIKSVTINGEPQAGPTYRLPAPDGGNNDAGAEYTVVATDNAGNETTATVRTYRRHHVKVISPDGKKTYADLMLPHNEYLVLQIRLPAGVSATLTDEADGTKIPYDKENGEFQVGLITKNRTLVLNYSTEYPKVELRLGTGQYFTGYNADSDEPYYLKGASMDENSYQIGMWVDTDAKPGYYLSSPKRYTQEELAALDESLWKEYKIAEATPGSIVLPFILITIDAAAYEENGGWYVYAKATNPTGTTYVSTPKMIIDVENPKAIDLSTGKELVSNGKYWGDLRFTVEDSSPVTVRHYTSPGGTAELLTPDEKGVYTISAEYDGSTQHMLVIEDACGNTTSYKSFKVCWNYLINVREKDHWDAPPAQPIRISKGQNLQEALSNINIGFFAADTNGWIPVDVSWKIPDDYDPQSRREQTFTVLGTVVLEGTGARCPSGLDVVPRPGEEWKKNISVQVTVEGDPQYKVTIADCANGTVTTNAAQTDADGTPLFYAGDLVMLSVVPDEGYRLKSLLVEEADSGLAVDHDDADSFIQPAADVRIIAEFEEIRAVKPTAIRVTGEYVYNGGEQLANVEGYDAETMNIEGNIATDAGTYTVSVTSKTGRWTDGTTDAATAQWRIERAEQEAPDGLQGVSPTTEGGSDGKITGTDTSMEYRAAAEASYTACTGSEIENLTAGSYFVRYAEDRNHFASPDTEVVVGEGEARSFTITFNANGGTGSMEPVTVEEGSRYVLPACGFTAPAGQEFKAWEIGGIEYNAGDDYVVLGNTEIKALWKDSAVIPTTFTITFNANGGTGSMEPVTVEEGSRYPLPVCGFTAPVNMQFSGWALSADGSVIADGAIMVTSNITLYAIWEPVPVNEFVVFFDGNGGTPAVSSMTTIGHRLAFLPGAFRSGSYRFDGWYTERNGGELITTSTVFAANTIVYAHWTYTGGSGGSGGYVPGYYIIRATAGAGGSITPSGDVSVRAGANQTFTITPNRGYAVSDVKIDGRIIGAVRSYTFENISASHTIEVQFRVRSSFVDVPSGSYYEDAVDWAVANGITTGTDAAHFSPDGICTRAQAVTFLWRAAGRPAPESRTMPFTDVPADSYYYDAVLWAVENGITKGTSSTTFSPDDTCTRAQIVTFLWRSEQSPAAGSSNPFTDVSADAYYADAVLWAVKEAITTGTTRTTFSPDAECTRAQIVTFLWRCKK